MQECPNYLVIALAKGLPVNFVQMLAEGRFNANPFRHCRELFSISALSQLYICQKRIYVTINQ
jgi:hypothetical protein